MVRIIPRVKVSSPNKNMNMVNTNAVKRAITPSLLISSFLATIKPVTMVDIPKIPAIFHILAPMATLIPISGFPVKMAIMAEPNSGSDVPTADAVTPSIISDIPSARPISTKLSTNMSADFITRSNEIIKTAISAMISINLSPAICFLLLSIIII